MTPIKLGAESMETHVVHVDSRDRDYARFPNPNAYRVRLPRKYRRVVSARLLGAELPSSYFVFSAALGNTSLEVRYGVGLASAAVASLPDGNYTAASLPDALAGALSAATGLVFTATIDPVDLRLTVVSKNNTFALDTRVTAAGVSAAPAEWGLGAFLGFSKGALAASDVDHKVVAPGVVNLNPYTYMFLDVAELANVETGGQFGTENGGKTFAKIPLSPVSFEYVFTGRDVSQVRVGTSEFRPPVQSLDRLSVLFRFHDGRAVDFNGVEHSFSIELTCRVEAAPALRPSFPPDPVVTVTTTHNNTNNIVRAGRAPPSPSPRRRRLALAAVLAAAALAAVWAWRRRRASWPVVAAVAAAPPY